METSKQHRGGYYSSIRRYERTVIHIGSWQPDIDKPDRSATTEHFREIVAGFEYSCGLTTSNVAVCWGNQFMHGLPAGASANDVRTPTAVDTPLRFEQIAAGAWHTCAVSVDDVAYCWGDNRSLALGTDAVASVLLLQAPVAVQTLLRFPR